LRPDRLSPLPCSRPAPYENLLEKDKSPRRRAPEAPSPRSELSLYGFATNEDPGRSLPIAELLVDRPHRLVSLLRVCDQLAVAVLRSEEHTSELQSLAYLECRLLL